MDLHTPTPWYSHEGARDSEFDYICGPRGTFICELDISHPEQKANVEFIVRACNVHDELLAFIEDIRPFLGNDPEATLHKQADALIAKAKGEIRIAGEASQA